MEDRNKFIIDDDNDEDNDSAQSDLVRVVLNLAFLTQEQAENFTFSKNSFKNIKQAELAKALHLQLGGKMPATKGGNKVGTNAIN